MSVAKTRDGVWLSRNDVALSDQPGECDCCGGTTKRYYPCQDNRGNVPGCAGQVAPDQDLLIHCDSVTCTNGDSVCALNNSVIYDGFCYRPKPSNLPPNPNTVEIIDTTIQCVTQAIPCAQDICIKAGYLVGTPCDCGPDCYKPNYRVLRCKTAFDTKIKNLGDYCLIELVPKGPSDPGSFCVKWERNSEFVVDPLPTDRIFTGGNEYGSCCKCCGFTAGSCTTHQCATEEGQFGVSNGTDTWQSVACGTDDADTIFTPGIGITNANFDCCCDYTGSGFAGAVTAQAVSVVEASLNCYRTITRTISATVQFVSGNWVWKGTFREQATGGCGYDPFDQTTPYEHPAWRIGRCGPFAMVAPPVSSVTCNGAISPTVLDGYRTVVETATCDARAYTLTQHVVGKDKAECYVTSTCDINIDWAIQMLPGPCTRGNCIQTRGGGGGERIGFRISRLVDKLLRLVRLRNSNPLIGAGRYI